MSLRHHLSPSSGYRLPSRARKLCVLFTDLGAFLPAEVHHQLAAGTLPSFLIPSVRDFIHIDEIPITAAGEDRLEGPADLALERQS